MADQKTKTKTNQKLTAEIGYLDEWVQHALAELPQYADLLIFYSTKKSDHGFSEGRLASLRILLLRLRDAEAAFKDVAKETKRLRRTAR